MKAPYNKNEYVQNKAKKNPSFSNLTRHKAKQNV